MRRDYYNDNDPFAAQWLRNLIDAGLIPPGDVDERSILDVRGDDLRGYRRCHFFAGIGGWAHALNLAGWGDEEVWTGSCPCQPFSVAGQGRADNDHRDLWPAFHRLIAKRRPAILFGEQTSGALGRQWLAGVRSQLERCGYRVGAANLPACSVGAPHRRDRLWFVADANGAGQFEQRWPIAMGPQLLSAQCRGSSAWADAEWLTGADGKARRVKPGVRLLAHGIPARVGLLRGFGNAITPPLAAEFIAAFMDIQ